jgi:hypothetical protein
MSYNRRIPKPELHDINDRTGSLDPRFHGVRFDVPAKLVHNDGHGSDMTLQKLYSSGPMKWPDNGRTCENCLNWYRDEKTEQTGVGRCKARGFIRTHKETPADDTNGWTDPVSGSWFGFWPGCPLFSEKSRLSRR